MNYRQKFELGVAEFNDGRFFESHDTFEEIWMEARGDRKRFLQGLIQASVGIFHSTCGNLRGAESQLSKGIEKLRDFAPGYHGVDVPALVTQLSALRESVVSRFNQPEDTPNSDLIPTISYTYDPSTVIES